MLKPRVSIVVPVYNMSKYLSECLDSLVNQTFKDIEIICVDDGSTDNSLDIMMKYADKDNRIIVLPQKNKGVSTARNNGIKLVKGDYITFVDPDDYLAENTIEVIYNKAKQVDCDILLFGNYKFSSNYCTRDGRIYNLAAKLQDRVVEFEDYSKDFINAPYTSWGKIYKTSLIKDNKILFPARIKCGEDRYFVVKAYINSKKIYAMKDFLYYYRQIPNNSLSRYPGRTVVHNFKVDFLIKKLILASDNLKDKHKVYKEFLYCSQGSIWWQWNATHNYCVKRKGYKYIKLLLQECKPYLKDEDFNMEKYNFLKKEVRRYRHFFLKKLFEPVFEKDIRSHRLVIYIFNRQVINVFIGHIRNNIQQLKYLWLLFKLRFTVKRRKLRVAFWYYEPEKWNSVVNLYREFESSEHFEPVIYLSAPGEAFSHITKQELFEENIEFLKKQNVKYEVLYDNIENEYFPIEDFKADIVFYQLPWSIPKGQRVVDAAKFALTCYVPYCFYSLKSNVNYFMSFHGKVWRYFVETEFHKNEYQKLFKAVNCVALGSAKFDNYRYINQTLAEKQWKTKNKKRIIYAPHHSIEASNFHNMATFVENGDFIHELAKKYKDKVEWIFRPHFTLKDRLIKHGIKTEKEIGEYYRQWEELGKISKSEDNYYEQFVTSDGLITDCISFLSEYLPVNKPVLHLRNKKQLQPFNDLVQNIIEGYYQIHNNEELESAFIDVIINGNDYLKDARKAKIKYLMIDKNKTTSEKIREYIERKLGIK